MYVCIYVATSQNRDFLYVTTSHNFHKIIRRPVISTTLLRDVVVPSLSLPIANPQTANTQLYGLHRGCSNNGPFCRHCYQQWAALSARGTTCTHATYQTLRLNGSQKVHVHSNPHLQGLRLVPRQLPTVVPARGHHRFQQLWTQAGVADFWTGPAQKYSIACLC